MAVSAIPQPWPDSAMALQPLRIRSAWSPCASTHSGVRSQMSVRTCGVRILPHTNPLALLASWSVLPSSLLPDFHTAHGASSRSIFHQHGPFSLS